MGTFSKGLLALWTLLALTDICDSRKPKEPPQSPWRLNDSPSFFNKSLPRRHDAFTYDEAHLPHDRNLIVHLFEWKWDDIADECSYLAENGFGAVQISPPTAHLLNKTGDDIAWHVRYQPTSYSLNSRGGTEAQLQNMIIKCNAVGVRIIVDLITNHMTSDAFDVDGKHNDQFPRSTDGRAFRGHAFNEWYEGPGYTAEHFHDADCNAYVDNYNDRGNVQFCKLVSLVDLNHRHPYVRTKVIELMNRLIDMGVMGFRMDASKHMPAEDMSSFMELIKPLNEKMFGLNHEPFIVHEVSSHPGEPIQASEYTHLGRVKNFYYGRRVTQALRNWEGKTAWDLMQIYENNEYGNMPSHEVLNFLDNHDNQRSEADHLITHKDEWEYRLAAAFMLAHTYGVPRLMSSYVFGSSFDQGPPNVGAPTYEARTPPRLDGGCGDGWVCEHRWAEIRRMAKWRSEMGGAAMALIHRHHNNCFGFARLERGYFALNNDRHNECQFTADTQLLAGVYCNVFAQDFIGGECARENHVVVNADGRATFKIYKAFVVALSVEARLPDLETPTRTRVPRNPINAIVARAPSRSATPVSRGPSNAVVRRQTSNAAVNRNFVSCNTSSIVNQEPSGRWTPDGGTGCLPFATPKRLRRRRVKRAASLAFNAPTVIFVRVKVDLGKKVFLRGGRPGQDDCHMSPNEFNKCAIPIRHLLQVAPEAPNVVYEHFAMWSQGDRYLDFHGAEHSQGTSSGDPADGTPLIYTTDRRDQPVYHALNAKYRLGDDHWMVVLDVNCSRDPTFDAKGYIKMAGYEEGPNHAVHCGRDNLLTWADGKTHLLDV